MAKIQINLTNRSQKSYFDIHNIGLFRRFHNKNQFPLRLSCLFAPLEHRFPNDFRSEMKIKLHLFCISLA